MDYLTTLSIKSVAGRLFSRAFPADSSQRIIVNERAIKAIGYQSAEAAIGKKVSVNRGGERAGFTIVGVVQDFHFEDLHLPITPYGFRLNDSLQYNYVVAHAEAGVIPVTIQAIEAIWRKYNPGEPFEYSFLDDDFQKNYLAGSRMSAIMR